MLRHLIRVLVISGMLITPQLANAASITGAGSTFIYPVFSTWANEYHQQTNNQINYQPVGSGGGLRQLSSKTIDFAASDEPLKKKELDEKGYIQFPLVSGGIVLAYQLPTKQSITLDGPTTAAIFSGQIKTWNDPAIAKLNPSVDLPKIPIIVVHRADASGTTYNFTYYLNKVSPQWGKNVGVAKLVSWPVAGIGGKGNAGVAASIKQIKGAIGYLEYTYAKGAKLDIASMKNASNQVIKPSLDSFLSTVNKANWNKENGFYLILNNISGENSWPIVATTFVLVPKDLPADKAKSLKELFTWIFMQPKAVISAKKLDMALIPTSVSSQVQSIFADVYP